MRAKAGPMGAKNLVPLVLGHVCLHACMAGLRMAAPLLALHQGYGPLAVGFLLALFSLPLSPPGDFCCCVRPVF